jgi:hypothetical protein
MRDFDCQEEETAIPPGLYPFEKEVKNMTLCMQDFGSQAGRRESHAVCTVSFQEREDGTHIRSPLDILKGEQKNHASFRSDFGKGREDIAVPLLIFGEGREEIWTHNVGSSTFLKAERRTIPQYI